MTPGVHCCLFNQVIDIVITYAEHVQGSPAFRTIQV